MNLNQRLLIETERLYIVPMTYSFVSKLLDDDISAYEEFEIKPVDEWPSSDTREILPILKENLSSQSYPDGYSAWLFIDKVENIIVGDGGFKGIPDDNGKIDIGYGIIESKRRQGYAFEAVTALIKWGFSQKSVKTITADCLKNNTLSCNLLRKLGMTEIREDEELVYFEMSSSEGK